MLDFFLQTCSRLYDFVLWEESTTRQVLKTVETMDLLRKQGVYISGIIGKEFLVEVAWKNLRNGTEKYLTLPLSVICKQSRGVYIEQRAMSMVSKRRHTILSSKNTLQVKQGIVCVYNAVRFRDI